MRIAALVSLALVLLLAGCGSEGGGPSGAAGDAGASSGGGGAVASGAGGEAGHAGAASGASGAGGLSGASGTSGTAGSAGTAGAGAGAGGAGAGQSGAGTTGAGTGGTASDAGAPGSDTSLAQRVCPPSASYDTPAPGTRTAQLVQGGFGFLEGPVWVASQGVLLFSDMNFAADAGSGPPSRIHRLMPPSSIDVFVAEANSNGLALIPEGFPAFSDGDVALACVHDARALAVVHANGSRTPLGVKYEGDQLNSPNDLTLRSDGTVYFTDPDWQLAGRPPEIGFTGVFRFTPAVSFDAALVSDALDKPNGITLSLDEDTLYVGSAGADVLAYPVAQDGSTGEPRVFASPGASDGMGIDCAGNLYITSGRQVKVYSPDGAALFAIDVAENPSNVAFGGDDLRTLYITAGAGLYSIELEIPGLPY